MPSIASPIIAIRKTSPLILALIFSIGIGVLGGPMRAHAQNSSEIPVATVNGEEIFLDEVMRLIDNLPPEIRQQPLTNYFDRLVDDIVDSRLAAGMAEKGGLAKNPEIARQINIAAQRVLAETWINTELAKAVTNEHIKAAYETFIADETAREEIHARHILVKDKKEAEDIIAQLKKGADFALLAQEKSTGPSGPDGGDLGYFQRGAMVPGFEIAAFNLKKGTFSKQPVQTQFGWHIIMVEDKRIAEAPSLDALTPHLRQNLITQNLGRILDNLRKNAKIERRPFEEIRNDAQKPTTN